MCPSFPCRLVKTNLSNAVFPFLSRVRFVEQDREQERERAMMTYDPGKLSIHWDLEGKLWCGFLGVETLSAVTTVKDGCIMHRAKWRLACAGEQKKKRKETKEKPILTLGPGGSCFPSCVGAISRGWLLKVLDSPLFRKKVIYYSLSWRRVLTTVCGLFHSSLTLNRNSKKIVQDLFNFSTVKMVYHSINSESNNKFTIV